MTTLLFTHPACLEHDTGEYHPECAERLKYVLQVLEGEEFFMLHREEAPRATIEQLLRAHPMDHIEFVRDSMPAKGEEAHLDSDTVIVEASWEAALRSAGSVIGAIDAVMKGECRNAFCAVRPPGHHCEASTPMGFCLFNNVAVGAYHARAVHGLKRIAVFDMDVHHGNGTQDIFFTEPDFLYVSTHQEDAYPGTGLVEETGIDNNIVNVPLPAGCASAAWREAVLTKVIPAIENFKPDLLLLSAGFDAHASDPMAHMRLTTQDFGWVTDRLCELAGRVCQNRLVSVLEGGYDLRALSVSVGAHVRALMGI